MLRVARSLRAMASVAGFALWIAPLTILLSNAITILSYWRIATSAVGVTYSWLIPYRAANNLAWAAYLAGSFAFVWFLGGYFARALEQTAGRCPQGNTALDRPGKSGSG
jgi:hypothetical protein